MRVTALLFSVFMVATAVAQDNSPIRIGTMFETSGNIASLGNQGYQGAQVVLDQINNAGGINGRRVELIQINTESDETKSVLAARRLLERENVIALIGPHNSGSNFAILDTVQRAEIPMVSNGTSAQIASPASKKPWIFMSQVTDAAVVGAEIGYMKKKRFNKIALLSADSAFAQSGREQWEILAPKSGIKIVVQEVFGNNDQDVSPQLTKIRSADVDAVIIWAAGPGQAIAVKNYRQLGIDKPVFTSHGCVDPNLLRLAGDAVNGVTCASSKIAIARYLPESDPQKPGLLQFIVDFNKKFGSNPSMFAGNGADALRMIAAAIKQNGTAPQKIRDGLEGLNNFVGLNYMFTYSPTDHFGAQPSSLAMMTVKDQKFVPAE